MFWAVYGWARSRTTETLDQSGVTAAEYALLIALIAIIIVAGAGTLATAINSLFTEISGHL
ncbi:MAG: Flp family type IVb pilin [Actinomycetota bacterium]